MPALFARGRLPHLGGQLPDWTQGSRHRLFKQPYLGVGGGKDLSQLAARMDYGPAGGKLPRIGYAFTRDPGLPAALRFVHSCSGVWVGHLVSA